MKERDTQRKVNLHAFFLNLKLASKIWKLILIVGKWSGLKYNYNEPTHEYIWFSTNEIEKKSKWLTAIPPDPLIHLFVSFASCFFCCLQTSMSVPKGFTIAVPMPFATIPKGLTTAYASPDSLGMAKDAKVHANVDFCTHEVKRGSYERTFWWKCQRTAVTIMRNAKHIANRAWIHKYMKSDNSYDKREEYFVGWYHEIWAGKRAEWLITLQTQVTLVSWRAIS